MQKSKELRWHGEITSNSVDSTLGIWVYPTRLCSGTVLFTRKNKSSFLFKILILEKIWILGSSRSQHELFSWCSVSFHLCYRWGTSSTGVCCIRQVELHRWIGDVSSVQALGKTVVGMRKDQASLELKAVHIPDHLDILATHPCGATVHFLVSSVLGASHHLAEESLGKWWNALKVMICWSRYCYPAT